MHAARSARAIVTCDVNQARVTCHLQFLSLRALFSEAIPFVREVG